MSSIDLKRFQKWVQTRWDAGAGASPAECFNAGHFVARCEEQKRLADCLAAQPPSQQIADIAAALGVSGKLDAAWDALHPDDAGKPRGYAQRGRLEER